MTTKAARKPCRACTYSRWAMVATMLIMLAAVAYLNL
tara:strand:+ start:1958 stop:2068 length:111 start_codon:yes stop_codon:yes gene_type:complete